MSEKKGCEKMSQKHQKGQARSISVNAIAEKPLLIWDYVAFAAIVVFCFLVFQQSDLLHTAGCSYGYLNGHFRDFYDYCGTFDISSGIHAKLLYYLCHLEYSDASVWHRDISNGKSACSCYFYGQSFYHV